MQGYDYSRGGAYFVTVCTKGRTPLFWEHRISTAISVGADGIRPYNSISADNICTVKYRSSDYGKIVENTISDIHVHYPFASVDTFVVMPDHVHLIVLIKRADDIRYRADDIRPYYRSLPTIIGQMKRIVSTQIGFPVWQRSFYDRIIRNENEYAKIVRYILSNPANWDNDEYFV